jgi:hypothetical protein
MKFGGVLPHRQQPATCSHSEPYQFSRYPFHFLEIEFNIVPPSTPRSSKWSLSLSFPHQTSISPLPIRAACPVHLFILETVYLKPTLILFPVQESQMKGFYNFSWVFKRTRRWLHTVYVLNCITGLPIKLGSNLGEGKTSRLTVGPILSPIQLLQSLSLEFKRPGYETNHCSLSSV